MSTATELGWTVNRIGPALGARVEGPDFNRTFTELEGDALESLLLEHLVLVLPDQSLEPEHHVELGRRFGEPLVHPFLTPIDGHPEILRVVKEPEEDTTFGGEFWHADITFMNPPSSVSLLQSLELPELGGDTLFANQYLAFETLSEGMQDLLEPLEAVHLYPGKHEDDSNAIAAHPVVRPHRDSGRRALFVNPAFTTRFVGMTERESKPLLDFLFDHQCQNEFVTRITWQPGQLTMWDNRAVQHYAMNDYTGHRRALQRVTAMEVDPIG
jgi:taurine dioxygenase